MNRQWMYNVDKYSIDRTFKSCLVFLMWQIPTSCCPVSFVIHVEFDVAEVEEAKIIISFKVLIFLLENVEFVILIC
jgi:hypothetical protein